MEDAGCSVIERNTSTVVTKHSRGSKGPSPWSPINQLSDLQIVRRISCKGPEIPEDSKQPLLLSLPFVLSLGILCALRLSWCDDSWAISKGPFAEAKQYLPMCFSVSTKCSWLLRVVSFLCGCGFPQSICALVLASLLIRDPETVTEACHFYRRLKN